MKKITPEMKKRFKDDTGMDVDSELSAAFGGKPASPMPMDMGGEAEEPTGAEAAHPDVMAAEDEELTFQDHDDVELDLDPTLYPELTDDVDGDTFRVVMEGTKRDGKFFANRTAVVHGRLDPKAAAAGIKKQAPGIPAQQPPQKLMGYPQPPKQTPGFPDVRPPGGKNMSDVRNR